MNELVPVETQPVTLKDAGKLGASVLQGLHEIILSERTNLWGILCNRRTTLHPSKRNQGKSSSVSAAQGAAQDRFKAVTQETLTSEPALLAEFKSGSQ